MSSPDPQVMVRYSDDDGHTWSAWIHYPLLNPDGSYLRRIKMFQQGAAFNRVYQVQFSEVGDYTGDFRLIGAHADISLGTD